MKQRDAKAGASGPMKSGDLNALLTKLHDQLLTARSLDAKDRELLRQLGEDIRKHTAGSPVATPQELRGRLDDAVVKFEVSHPQLSQTLGLVIDTLALYNI
jgi:hypothetical protein